MARVDFTEITEAIRGQLAADSTLDGIRILIEAELSFDAGPLVIIYLLNASEDPEQQGLAAGTTSRLILRFEIMPFAFAVDKKSAIKLRNDLVGRVHIALMKDRTFSGKVTSSWYGEFNFDAGDSPGGGFFSGASIELVVDATATTT